MSKGNALKSEELAEKLLNSDTEEKRNQIFAQMADCLFEADTFDPIANDLEIIECQYDTNKRVWKRLPEKSRFDLAISELRYDHVVQSIRKNGHSFTLI